MTDSSSNASLVTGKPNTPKGTKDDEHKSAPLGKSVKQYSTLVWWMLGLSIAILYSGYDSVILGTLNAVDAYQRDWGEWMFNDDPKPEKAKWEWTIPALWLSLWDGIGPLGQIAGTALGGWLVDRRGRRFCLMVGSTIGIVAILELFFSNRPADKEWRRIMLLIGKVLQGFGLGIIKIGTITYMSEVTPTKLKGPIMSLIPTFTLFGQFIGAIIIYVVSEDLNPRSYLIALGSQWAVAIPPFIMAFILPESPAYLLLKNDKSGALTSFRRLLGPKNDAKAAVDIMEHTIEEEARNAVSATYWDCFNAANRRRTLIVMFAGCIEFFFGLSLLSSVSYFLQQMDMESGKSILFLIGGIFIGTLANLGSSWTISHFGRRQLVTTSFLIAAGLWGVMGFAGIKQFPWTAWLAGGLCTAIIIVCGLGCWPASYAILGETSSLRLRSKTMSLGSLMNNLTGILANFVQPFLYNPDALDLGAKTGFAFAGLSLVGATFTYLFVPELKGRSALEIDNFFAKGVRAIGSTKWRDTHEEVPLDDTRS
ncbi:MFS general substrate transporter [Lindgomyces ingoldianus]|uniref:MFS general substrate transporter n=1 Tax=Lindgomyces ingoldianus TaxID=673940 RepID=A0ACB6Q724_9PLEO|nr:MFS general substrate transporter [Lindgomyces ingoldianus]KAF2462631.1 MFS general substrate transporter [Lindgomyces ingoldianus]